MASITGDSSNIFINHGNLVMSQDVYADVLHPSSVTFKSNIVLTQSGSSIAIGNQAGLGQNVYSVAIGYQAGENQQEGAVAIGGIAGYSNQQENAIAIGYNAGDSFQGVNSVAIGVSAGATSQNNYAVAIGSGAGYENQGLYSIAIGRMAGDMNQHARTIVLNATGAELDTQQEGSLYVAPVRNATGTSLLAYDSTSNEVTQTNVLNGTLEATGITTSSSVTFNTNSIQITQTSPSIFGGNQVAIGSAPVTNQGQNAVAIGASAGLTNQSEYSVAIGNQAGYTGQGISSIAIGSGAGVTNQHDHTIILYANAVVGSVLNSKQAGSFYVDPIRKSSDTCQVLGYSSNCEVLQTSSITVMNSNVGISNTTPGYPFVVGNQYLTVGTNSHIGVNAAPNNAQMTIVNSNGTHTVLAVSGTSDQTANLQTWSNTNGTVLASVSNIGGLTIAGPLARKAPVMVSATTYTVKETDTWIIADTASINADIILTLPGPGTCPGRELNIRKKIGGTTHQVDSSDSNIYNLAGNTTNVIITKSSSGYNTLTYLVSDGTYWVIVNAL